MKVIRVFGFYFLAALTLGSLCFVGWLSSDWLFFRGPFWPGDAFLTWALALAATASFVILICTPLQLLATKFPAPLALLAGVLSGPLFVWLLLMLRSETPTIYNYLSAPGVIHLHVLFAAIGLLFAVGFRHVYGGEFNHQVQQSCDEL